MGGKLKKDLCRWPWWLMLPVNWALVPFALLTWRGGAPVWGAYLLIQAGTIILNDRVTGSRWALGILCANLLAATVIAHKLSTQLYHDNVNTYLTQAIGQIGMQLGVVAVLIASAVAVVMKGRTRKGG